MEDPVLEWLDRLDEHWSRSGQSPPLLSWLREIELDASLSESAADMEELVSELFRADLNWRLRSSATPRTDNLLAAELLEFPQVKTNARLGQQLLDDEFVFRCQSRDNETIEHFAKLVSTELGQSEASLRDHFLQIAIERNPIDIKLFMPAAESDGPVLKCALLKSLEIGRANEKEPPSPALLSGDPARLIVAPPREVSLSRNQILLERDQWSSVKVKNISAKVPITIGDTRQIQPQRSITVQVPFVLLIGKARIRVEAKG